MAFWIDPGVSHLSVSRPAEGSVPGIRSAMIWQLLAGIIGLGSAFLLYDVRVASGVGFGVLVVMLSTLLLARRIDGAANSDPQSGQRLLYSGAVVRFVCVLAALLLAYGIGLHLLAVAVGMVLAQAAMFGFALAGVRAQLRQGKV